MRYAPYFAIKRSGFFATLFALSFTIMPSKGEAQFRYEDIGRWSKSNLPLNIHPAPYAFPGLPSGFETKWNLVSQVLTGSGGAVVDIIKGGHLGDAAGETQWHHYTPDSIIFFAQITMDGSKIDSGLLGDALGGGAVWDLETATLHEVGHALGLGHLTGFNLMSTPIPSWTAIRYAQTHDYLWIVDKYGGY